MSLESLTKEDLQSLVNVMWRINENVSDKLFEMYNNILLTRERFDEFMDIMSDTTGATPNALEYIERRSDQETGGH